LGLNKSETKDLALATYEALEPRPPKRLLASAFDLSRSGLYYETKLPDKDNELRWQIESLYQTDDTLGCRKLATLLQTSKNRVFRVMLKYGLSPRRNRPKYRYPGKAEDVVNNKLLNLEEVEKLKLTILFSDIFQFRLADGTWVYCCFVIRRETRQILAFSYGYSQQADLVAGSLRNVQTELEKQKEQTQNKFSDNLKRKDLIQDLEETEILFHSDQGKQYGAKITLDVCLANHFERSMSRAGTPTDNGMAERFVQTFKLAICQRYSFTNLLEFEEAATNWLNFYNNQRPHQSLGQKSPNGFAKQNDLETIPYLSLNFV
jgi:transposase InsO family protein